jgi:uncharacterized protein YndB with AHSA1/START domain
MAQQPRSSRTPPLPPVEASVDIPLSRDEAFSLFANDLGAWWPLPFTFSLDRFADARIQPRPGDRWFERDIDGEETSWGLVRAYDAPQRIVLGFAISPQRTPESDEKASEVEVIFERLDEQATRLRVAHRNFERHGEGAATLRDGMASRQGWPLILAAYARCARQRAASAKADRHTRRR